MPVEKYRLDMRKDWSVGRCKGKRLSAGPAANRVLLAALLRLSCGEPSPRCVITPLDAGQRGHVKRCYPFLMRSPTFTPF